MFCHLCAPTTMTPLPTESCSGLSYYRTTAARMGFSAAEAWSLLPLSWLLYAPAKLNPLPAAAALHW